MPNARPHHPLPRLALAWLALLCTVAAARAQTVRWEADASASSSLQLVFEDCAPDGNPDLPAIPGVTLTFVGQSENVSIVNFQMTRSVILSYVLRARQAGPLQIPSFLVKTSKGSLRVPAFNATGPSASLESVAGSRLLPERTTVWAGEVFGLTYELSAARRNNPQVQPTFDWNAAPLTAEDWSKPEIGETSVGGQPRVVITFRTRAFARTANTLKLEAASHLMSIQTGTVGFGFLSQPRMEPVSVTSDQPTLEVRPLPVAPAGFSGAVGQFKLTSKVIPEKAAVGEPVTWTLELTGTGNWPDLPGLPARDVSSEFQVVQPKAKRAPKEGKLFDVTLAEDVVLVPTRAGTYPLGPVSFTYFDPRTGTYQTVSTPRTTVTITAPAAPAAAAGRPAGTDASGPPAARESDEAPRAPVKDAVAPSGLPRDPLPGTDVTRSPEPRSAIVMQAAIPLILVVLCWLGLALQRARRTDPVEPARLARRRLLATLERLSSAGAAERAPLLLAWQADTRILWQIRAAASPAEALPDEVWRTLWTEADRALYGADATLAADWATRAHAAATAKRVRGFQPLRLFLARNLFPFAAALAVAASLGWSLQAAGAKADPLAAYRAGDFAAAEAGWRQAVGRAPTDWIARHNLSLALLQQERPGEALGHATAAAVQEPGLAAARWNLAVASERTGIATLPVLVGSDLRSHVARLASPADWQAMVVGAAWLLALGLGGVLWQAYRPSRRAWRRLAWGVAALALVAGSLAATGAHAYGLAADPRAALIARNTALRSIPTEADTAQKTTPVSAGTPAVIEGEFLRWRRLAFENGQTGWVRADEIVPLWR